MNQDLDQSPFYPMLDSKIYIIEKLMQKRLNKFLEKERCLYNLKFSLRVNCSTNNALMSIIRNIQTNLDDSKYVPGIFVHLKKPFDTS